MTLVVAVESADIMSSLIKLKQEAETQTGSDLRLTFTGASEAHIIAQELGKNRVGVILTRPRPFPMTWESKRM
jgi:hypothetical protein